MTREEMIRIICEHTGWEPDWDCTVRLADDIEAKLTAGHAITWPTFGTFVDIDLHPPIPLGGKKKP